MTCFSWGVKHPLQRRAIRAGIDKIRQGHILRRLFLGAEVHENLILHASGGIGSQSGTLGRVEGGDAFDQADGADGDQIFLIGGLGVIFFRRLMLVGRAPGE